MMRGLRAVMPRSPARDSIPAASSYWRDSARLTAGSLGAMLDRRSVWPNVAAGITVSLVALPLNLALALACGLPPSVGLVSGAVGGVIGALFGASRLQITGPEVALAPITLAIVARHGFEGLLAVTFMAGMMQIALGVLRVGRLVNAIPIPVIGGFLAAVGLLVFDSQLPHVLGLAGDARLLSDIRDPAVLRGMGLAPIALAALVIAMLIVLPRVNRHIPPHLVAVVASVAAVLWLGLDVPTIEPIAAAFPAPALPSFSGLDLLALVPEAIALALLASIDSLLCAIAVDTRTRGERTRSDQELVAQGLANLGCACFGGMPVAAAVVRSVAALEAGATTRLASLVQAALLAIVLVVLAPLVSYVPLVALAAILLVIGYRLINVRQLAELWQVSRFEAVVFLITAFSIVTTDFVTGVVMGTIAALAYFARQQRLAMCPRDLRVSADSATAYGRPAEIADTGLFPSGPIRRVLRFEGPLFFGSQDKVESAIAELDAEDELMLDLSHVSTVDVSGAIALAASLERLSQSGVQVHVLTRGAHRALDWVLERCTDTGITRINDLSSQSGHVGHDAHDGRDGADERRDQNGARRPRPAMAPVPRGAGAHYKPGRPLAADSH